MYAPREPCCSNDAAAPPRRLKGAETMFVTVTSAIVRITTARKEPYRKRFPL
jgi:hypothetical protein